MNRKIHQTETRRSSHMATAGLTVAEGERVLQADKSYPEPVLTGQVRKAAPLETRKLIYHGLA